MESGCEEELVRELTKEENETISAKIYAKIKSKKNRKVDLQKEGLLLCETCSNLIYILTTTVEEGKLLSRSPAL